MWLNMSIILVSLRYAIMFSAPWFFLVFFKKNSILSFIVSRNMCKSRRKLRIAKIYPLEVQSLQQQTNLMSFYGQFMQLFHISEPTLSKQFFSKLEFLFSVLGSMVSKNIWKLRHKLKNAKNLLELTWSWQIKPWFSWLTQLITKLFVELLWLQQVCKVPRLYSIVQLWSILVLNQPKFFCEEKI